MALRSSRETAIRLLALLSLAWAAGAAAFALLVVPRMVDGAGQPVPSGVRAAVAAAVALLGLAFPAGMALYGRRYVLELVLHEAAGEVEATLVGFLRPASRRVALADLRAPVLHEGRFDSRRTVSVDAPWISLHVRGGPALVLDANEDSPDPAALEQILTAARAPRP